MSHNNLLEYAKKREKVKDIREVFVYRDCSWIKCRMYDLNVGDYFKYGDLMNTINEVTGPPRMMSLCKSQFLMASLEEIHNGEFTWSVIGIPVQDWCAA